jgi:16S rRNA (cytosine1402-N4)-methyltransferase
VNCELAEIGSALPRLARMLRPGGRVAVISFHSLEDRIVKRFFARASQPYGGDAAIGRLPLRAADLPQPPLRLVGRAVKPSTGEIAANSRARSAVLRIAERTDAPWPLTDPA